MSLPAPIQTASGPRRLGDIEDEITELAAHIHAATFRLLELIREFDEREGWGGPGLRSCAHWLNWKCSIGLGAAREKVRVAHALANLQKISDEFRQGRISFSKVRAMTRVATVNTNLTCPFSSEVRWPLFGGLRSHLFRCQVVVSSLLSDGVRGLGLPSSPALRFSLSR